MGLTAKKALGASKKYTDDQIAQIPGGTVVDVVEDGNMSAVTSNAVYDEAQEIKLSISELDNKIDSNKIIFFSQTDPAPRNGEIAYDFVMPGYSAVTELQVCSYRGNGFASIVVSNGEYVWSISGNPTNVVYGKLFMKNS